jgi:single-strand DNA-binding protein
MRTYQAVTILGRVGSLSDVAETRSGNKVVNLSVATDRVDGEGNRHPEWHRVTAWGELAELVSKYVTVGDAVHVAGRLRYGTYVRDGVEIPTAEIIAADVSFIGRPTPSGNGAK